jgi:hypothetical protein
MTQAVSRRPVPRRTEFDPRSANVNFVLHQLAARQFFPQVPLPYTMLPPYHTLNSHATSTQTDRLTERKVICEKCGWWGHFWDPKPGGKTINH